MSRLALSSFLVSATAETDELSLLQLQAKRRWDGSGGLCGFGVFTKTKEDGDATIKDMLDEFTEKCNSKYEGNLCESLESELFDGLNKDAKVANSEAEVAAICEELGALVAADQEHSDLEQGEGSLLMQRSKDMAAGKSTSMDGALTAKGSPRRRRNPPPPRCHAGHCSNHGWTNDHNANDGCHCHCHSGWGGGNCGTDIRCQSSVCNGHGTTSDANRLDGCTCSCNAGWGGSTCEADVTCKEEDCNGHGTTEDLNRADGCTCVCQFGWTGQSCDGKMTKEEKAAARAEAKAEKKAEAAAARAEAKAQKKAAAEAQRAEAKAAKKAEAAAAREEAKAARQEEAATAREEAKAAKKEEAAAARAEAKAAKKEEAAAARAEAKAAKKAEAAAARAAKKEAKKAKKAEDKAAKKAKFIGCYADDGNRDLEDGPKQYGYTVATCALECGSFKFFALQNGGWCVCGDAYSTASQYSKRPDGECGGGCNNENSNTAKSVCGGGWRNAVYKR